MWVTTNCRSLRELMALDRQSEVITTQYCVVEVNFSDVCVVLSQSKVRTAYHLSNGRQSAVCSFCGEYLSSDLTYANTTL